MEPIFGVPLEATFTGRPDSPSYGMDVDFAGMTVEGVVADGVYYVRADEAFWQDAGYADVAASIADRWVLYPDGASAMEGISFPALWSELVTKALVGGYLDTTVAELTELDGTAAYHYVTEKQGREFWVTAEGEPRLLRAVGEGGIEVTTTGWDATEVPAAPDDAMALTGEPAPPAPEPEDGEAPDVPDGEVPSLEKIWPTVVERARSASSVTSSSVEAGTYEPRTQIITGQTDDSNFEQRSLLNGKASTERLVDGVTYLKGDVAYWDSAIELADRWLIKPDEGSPLLFTPSQEIEDLLAWVGPAEGTEMVRAELTTFRGAPAYRYTLVTPEDDPRQVWVSAEKEPRLLMVAIDQGGDEWGVYTLTDWDRVEPVAAPEGAVPLGQ